MVLLSNLRNEIMINSNVRDMFNVDPVTGIAYGYINANNVSGDVLCSILDNGIDYRRLEMEIDLAKRYGFVLHEQQPTENYFQYLDRVNGEMLDFLNAKQDEGTEDLDDDINKFTHQWEDFTGDLHVATVDDTTVLYNTDSNTICVMESGHIGKYFACSPCCPNAGDLDSPDGDVGTYDVPASWRDLDF